LWQRDRERYEARRVAVTRPFEGENDRMSVDRDETDPPAAEDDDRDQVDPGEAEAPGAAETEAPSEAPRASHPPPDEPEYDERQRRQRRRLEGVLRESFRRAVEKGLEAGLGAIESSVDVLEKSVEAGRGTFQHASTSLKGVVDDVKMPKEVASYVFAQVDETKNVLIRAVAREVHDFLDATDIAKELQRALTSLSFEIKTEIRFIPNEKGLVRPEVKSKAAPKRGHDDAERRAGATRPIEEEDD
jgi:hypothetical protein